MKIYAIFLQFRKNCGRMGVEPTGREKAMNRSSNITRAVCLLGAALLFCACGGRDQTPAAENINNIFNNKTYNYTSVYFDICSVSCDVACKYQTSQKSRNLFRSVNSYSDSSRIFRKHKSHLASRLLRRIPIEIYLYAHFCPCLYVGIRTAEYAGCRAFNKRQ